MVQVFSPRHGGNRQWAAEMAGIMPQDVVDFSASINPLGPPRSALEAIQANLIELRYYPDPSYSELKNAWARFYGVDSDRLLPGNGAAELLTWVARDLANLDSTVIFRPAFADYDRALDTFHGTRENLSIFAENFPDQINQIQHPNRKGLLLNNPHNPTGKLISRSEILTCLDRFSLVVIDEAFMDFLPPDREQSCIDLIENYPNLIILRSLTKFYSIPGLRLGMVIADPDRIKRWQKWRDPWNVNSLAAVAGIAVLKDREFQQQTWQWLESSRSDLFRGIERINGFMPHPSAANFLLIKTKIAGSELQKYLIKEYKILIRDCLSFSELGDRYIRLAVLTQTEHHLLLNALESISERNELL